MTLAASGKNTLRYSSMISAVAASLIALLPPQALAQAPPPQTQAEAEAAREAMPSVRDRSRPEYETPGVRVGSFTLRGALALDAAHTNNLFAAPSGSEVDDMIYTIAPSARLSSNWSSHYLAIDGNYSSRNHADFSNEDADTYGIGANARIDVTRATRINGGARFAHLVTPRTDPDSPLVGSPIEYDRTNASVGLDHQFARFNVRGDVFMTEYDYDGSQNFRDNEENGLRGRVQFDMGPRIDLLFQATLDERDYTNTPTLSSEGRSYLVGAVFKGDIVNGEVSVGAFERDYDGPGIGTSDGLAVNANVDWNITQLTTINLNARRHADDQVGSTLGQPYVSTEFGVGVDHELRRNVILSASARRGEREYDPVDRNDEYWSFDAGGEVLLNRRASLRLRYEHDQVDSSGAASFRDYDADLISAGITVRL